MEYSSFIFMLHGHSLDVAYVSESVSEVLGFDQRDLLNRPIELFLDPNEKDEVMAVLRDTIGRDKAACMAYFALLHNQEGFVACTVAHSAANNIIVGSVSQAAAGAAIAAARNRSAEEVIVITESVQPSGDAPWRSSIDWPQRRAPRTAFILDRFSVNCNITHCTNGAILDPETCVGPQNNFFRYVAERDEERVRTFIRNLKRAGVGASAPADVGFEYEEFTMCVSGRELTATPGAAPADGFDEVKVSVVGSATSDGLILIVRRDA